MLIYVDGMLLISKEKSKIDKLKEILNSEFDMKNMGEAKKILGINIKRDRKLKHLFLNQKEYLNKLIDKFSMRGAKPASLPLSSQLLVNLKQKAKTEIEIKEMEGKPYANAIGSVMYSMVCTRPDLAYSISVLSRFMGDPGKHHWTAMKWMLRYVAMTTGYGLKFKKNSDTVQVEGFVDADFAGDRVERKSTTSYIFLVSGNCISWKSQLQPIVALSSTESEYIAATEAIKEGLWIQGLLRELKVYQGKATVYTDSQSALYLCKNPMFHDRTKHIEVRYHFIREKVTHGLINIEKVPSAENPADMGTKVVTLSKFQHCLELLGIGNE